MTAAARPGPGHVTAEDTNRNRCSSSQKNAEITRNRFEEVSTVSGEAHATIKSWFGVCVEDEEVALCS